jgi:ubiquinone/menaquinone biosynthesis C-methylase UbiE
MAWTYDWVAATVSVGQWKDWVLSILPYVRGPRILELGHGPGHLQLALHQKHTSHRMPDFREAKNDWQVLGLDRSPQMNRLAYARLYRAGCFPQLVNGMAENLPFPNESFHSVISTFPSEYILHPHTLTEVWRVLVSGGTFAVLPLAWITGRRLPERLAAWLFRVTGEAPVFQDRALDPLRQIGFRVRTEFLRLPSSQLLIVEAHKPSSCITIKEYGNSNRRS